MARTRSTPPTFRPTPASQALKMRRVELGKSQADVAFDSGVLTQTTVSELERGKYGPEDLTASRLSALAKGLNWTVAELEKATGIDLGLTTVYQGAEEILPVGHREDGIPYAYFPPKPKPPLPDELQQAIELYSTRYPDLAKPEWQDYLASFKNRSMEADTPEDWLDFYRNLVRFGVQPGQEN